MNIKNTLIAGAIILLFTAFVPYSGPEQSGYSIVSLEYQEEGETQTFYRVNDSDGMPVYFFRKVNQYPCKGKKECEVMDLTLYFDIYGNYMMYQLKAGKKLTKLNHKEFADGDYKKLHKILNNENSELKYCNYNDLTMAQSENQYHVDAVSGATVEDAEFEYINGAIKTTYALWKIAHGSIGKSIQNQTFNAMLEKSETAKPDWTEAKLSFKQVWEKYQQADEFEKVLCLMYMQSKKYILADANNGLLNQMNNQPLMVYTGILNVLSKEPSNAKNMKEQVLPVLDTGKEQQYIVAYNAVQRVGYNRLLRNYELNIWPSQAK